MILGGDELMRSQQGNNNAYCQDNDISWFNWEAVSRNRDMVEFFRKTIAFTRRYPILQRRKFFLGKDLDDDRVPDLTWFGKNLGWPDWPDPELRTLCYQLDGGEEKSEVGDYLLFLILNAHWAPQRVLLPPPRDGSHWFRVIDTSLPSGEDFVEPGREVLIDPPDHYLANARSTVVLLGR